MLCERPARTMLFCNDATHPFVYREDARDAILELTLDLETHVLAVIPSDPDDDDADHLRSWLHDLIARGRAELEEAASRLPTAFPQLESPV